MRNRLQRYLTPRPCEDLPYGLYIQYLLARDAMTRDSTISLEQRAHEHGRTTLLGQDVTAGLSRHSGEFDLRSAESEDLATLAEAHGWLRSEDGSYEKPGRPSLVIPVVIARGDVRAVTDALAADDARGGE